MRRERIDQILFFALIPFAVLACGVGISQAIAPTVFWLGEPPFREIFSTSEALLLVGWILQKTWLKSNYSDFILRAFFIALLTALFAFIVPVHSR